MLVMGNSRARYQVIPDSFALPTYSLCHAGMAQNFQTGLLQILESEHKLPKVILLHVDLGEYLSDETADDIGTLRYYYGKVPFVTNEINNISKYEQVKYLFGFYRYNGRVISQVKNFIQSQRPLPLTNGYQPVEPFAIDTLANLGNRNGVESAKKFRFHYGYMNKYLGNFIQICKKNNVKLLCFTSPYHQTYDFTAKIIAPIDSLLHAQHIPYLNSTQAIPVLRNHRLFWYDNDHLNRLGAPYFSQQVAQWAKQNLADTQAQ